MQQKLCILVLLLAKLNRLLDNKKGAVALKFSAQPFFHIKSKSQTSKSLALIVKYIYANKQDFT